MTAVHVLGSFHYFRRKDLTTELSRYPGADFLADSGGFSAHNAGATVTVPDYAAWLRDHASVINAAAALDVIGDPAATARNTDELIRRVDGAVPIVPVFHVSSPWAELERLCREHPYVMLGGAVAVAGRGRVAAMLRWCVKAHQIARDHDTRLHGLGLTRPPYPEKLPWYSVDSSYWTSANRTGSMSLFDGARMVGFRLGTPKAAPHADLIRRYGGNPRRAVMPGFGLVREVGPSAREDRDWATRASVDSLLRYERWLRHRRPVVAPPRESRTHGDGIKVYLACTTLKDVALVVARTRLLARRPADPEGPLSHAAS